MSNVVFVGTSHIAKQSEQEIRKAFKEHIPEIVALELDHQRLRALLNDEKTSLSPKAIRQIGILGYLFAAIGGFAQRYLGKIVGTKPGAEMKAAIEEARKAGTTIFLIDQNLLLTLKKLSTDVPAREKLKLLLEIFVGPFRNKELDIDLRKVPDEKTVKLLTEELKKRFPTIYKVLVSDRNEVMAENIINIKEANPEKKILVVIGEGHRKELEEMVK